MEDAWVLPVRMCNRQDAISLINVESGVLVRYVLTVCLPVLDIYEYVQYYMSLTVSLWF